MNRKVIILHNKYKISGGEDAVVKQESLLLKKNGDLIDVHYLDNNVINGFLVKVLVLIQTPFVCFTKKTIDKLIVNKLKPSVIHVHNYFPLLSPSIFYTIKREKIPVVHTLHNYRSVCPTALLMFDGKIEERSVKKTCWWAVRKKVYRNSAIGTFALCCMIELHKKLGTWHNKVDAFITLTEFSRDKFIEAGWPADKIYVKPNFIVDKFNGAKSVDKKGGFAVYVGRLSEEKDIVTLLKSWQNINFPLKIIGTGPLKHLVTHSGDPNIEYLGKLPSEQVIDWVKDAEFLVLPSICYEGFPMVLVEAMCCGTPSIVSKLGSMEEIISHGKTGLHFEAGNSDDLSLKVNNLIENKALLATMAYNARQEYLAKYTPEINYQQLMTIYQHAIANAAQESTAQENAAQEK